MSQKDFKHSYLAGLLDGDGSIYVRLKPNDTYRYGYQVSPAIVFYQSNKEAGFIEGLCKEYSVGYIRARNDGIVEWIIGDQASIKKILNSLLPYLRVKKEQANLMLEILEKKETVNSAEDFLELAKLVDRFEDLNYSKKRNHDSQKVKVFLKEEGLLSP